jgi:hypothetical protein
MMVSRRPCLMPRWVRPLSADALCWKNTIHGVTVAPMVEATSSSVFRLPPGKGEKVASDRAA